MLNLSVRYQARELIHSIGLLTRCIQIPDSTDKQRAAW